MNRAPKRWKPKHIEKLPTLTMADYYQRLLASPGPTTTPTFNDYRRAAGID